MAIFSTAPQAGDADIPQGKHAVIEMDMGTLRLELYDDVAPNTVANFKALAGKNFYDGLTFHRVIPGFVAQGGDPEGTGMGGPGYQVKAEFNERKHERGSLAMARSQHPDSAGSQFYICLDAQPHLDRQYTVFGKVIEGEALLNDIRVGSVMNTVRIED